MPQKLLEGKDVSPGPQVFHRASMAHRVRRAAGGGNPGRIPEPLEKLPQPRASERISPLGDEERIPIIVRLLLEVLPERAGGGCPKRHRPVLVSLPEHHHSPVL